MTNVFDIRRLLLCAVLLLISQTGQAQNCSNFNMMDPATGTWTVYGDVFSVGALFTPQFSGGLAATYLASSGQTAYYSFPSSVAVAANNVTAYHTILFGTAGAWAGQIIQSEPNGYIWVGGSGARGRNQQANKSGQNCNATIRATPVSGTTSQNIGGITVNVSLDGGQTINASGLASTVTPMTTVQYDVIRFNMLLSSVSLNLSTSGRVVITVPVGTPDGDYTGTIDMPYTVTACAGYLACQDSRLWAKAHTGVSNIKASIKIRVKDGKPVDPDTSCKATSGATLAINHGSLLPNTVSGNKKSNTIVVSCTGGAAVPVKIKLSPVGSPHTGAQLTGNQGVLTPLTNGTDSLVTLDSEGVTEKTITVSSTATIAVNSELKVGSSNIPAGVFSGSAVATITYQ